LFPIEDKAEFVYLSVWRLEEHIPHSTSHISGGCG